MGHRTNIVIDDDIWEELKTLPRGEISRQVNAELANWAERRKRQRAGEAMDRIRSSLPTVGRRDIVEMLRQDRQRLS